jgi:hypothetical protein
MAGKTRASESEIEARVTKIVEFILDGRTRSYILNHAAREWHLSRSAVDVYIKQANEQVAEINEASRAHNLAIITNAQWNLYRIAVKKNNEVLARQLLVDMAKLRGLEEQTINHIIEKRELGTITDDELEEALTGANEIQ